MNKNKPIKIFFGIDYEKVKNTLPINILIENFKIKKVSNPTDADLSIDVIRGVEKYSNLKNKKILIISSDNLNFKKNLFSVIESFFNKIGLKNAKYKIMDKLDLLIPKNISSIPIMSFFGKYEKIMFNKDNKQNNKFYFLSTNKLKIKNSISFPLFISVYCDDLKKLLHKKTTASDDKKFCAFVVSSNSSRERIDFFKKLSKYKRVDSYGKSMKNTSDDKIGKNWKDNSKLFKGYKFVICFENSFDDDYITEKLLNVMFSGSIPIYRGAPNVKEYFNTKSFINYDDYGSYEKMIKKVIELDIDNKKYNEMKTKPWFKNNKIPKIINNKKSELIKFYEKILKEPL